MLEHLYGSVPCPGDVLLTVELVRISTETTYTETTRVQLVEGIDGGSRGRAIYLIKPSGLESSVVFNAIVEPLVDGKLEGSNDSSQLNEFLEETLDPTPDYVDVLVDDTVAIAIDQGKSRYKRRKKEEGTFLTKYQLNQRISIIPWWDHHVYWCRH